MESTCPQDPEVWAALWVNIQNAHICPASEFKMVPPSWQLLLPEAQQVKVSWSAQPGPLFCLLIYKGGRFVGGLHPPHPPTTHTPSAPFPWPCLQALA